MIRRDLASELAEALAQAPAITLTGPRQSGKTTLCRALFPEHPYRNLENPDERAFAAEDARGFLAQFPRGAVIDEVQRVPELLSYLQGIIDENPEPGRWVLTGSRNLALMESVSQSLAGRTEILELLPLAWDEVRRFDPHPGTLDEAMLSGGYPRILDRKLDPSRWLRSYARTYLERDVRMVSNVRDLVTFQRFLQLCAGRTGQLLNYSSLAGDCGISQPTAKAWMSILEATYIIFRLPAFHANLRKRLVKMPKLHFYDTGLVCWLLGIRSSAQLHSHPLRGAVFESWVVSEVMKHRTNRGEPPGFFHYRDRSGAEADLILEGPSGMTLVEVKSSATPSSALFTGAERVRHHFARSGAAGIARPEIAVVYGGSRPQSRMTGKLIPWRQVAQIARTTMTAD